MNYFIANIMTNRKKANIKRETKRKKPTKIAKTDKTAKKKAKKNIETEPSNGKSKKLEWKDWKPEDYWQTDYNPFDLHKKSKKPIRAAVAERFPDSFRGWSDKNAVAIPVRAIAEKHKEMVNHPSHYGGADNVYETIKVIEAWNLEDFCLGNTIKYISRAGKKDVSKKGIIEDLKKALFYLQRKISNLEKDNEQ